MILAIDDDEGRFDGLIRFLQKRRDTGFSVPDFKMATCPSCVRKMLPQAKAVLLDYDLGYDPDQLGCCQCHESVPRDLKGTEFLPDLRLLNAPVCVVSANTDGGREMHRGLMSSLSHVSLIRATETEPELRWLGWLYVHGAI